MTVALSCWPCTEGSAPISPLATCTFCARIAVAISPEPFPPGVDTLDDLVRAETEQARQRAAAASA